jgi:hypothetical protein
MPVAASKAKALFTIGKLNLTPLLRDQSRIRKVNLTPLLGKLNLTPLFVNLTPLLHDGKVNLTPLSSAIKSRKPGVKKTRTDISSTPPFPTPPPLFPRLPRSAIHCGFKRIFPLTPLLIQDHGHCRQSKPGPIIRHCRQSKPDPVIRPRYSLTSAGSRKDQESEPDPVSQESEPDPVSPRAVSALSSIKLNTPWKTFSLHRPLNRLTQDISS